MSQDFENKMGLIECKHGWDGCPECDTADNRVKPIDCCTTCNGVGSVTVRSPGEGSEEVVSCPGCSNSISSDVQGIGETMTNFDKIGRYDPYLDRGDPELLTVGEGAWVSSSDFDALLAEYKVTRRALENVLSNGPLMMGNLNELEEFEHWLSEARSELTGEKP